MKIEGFEVGEIVSRGKIAVVHRARQLSLDRTVAVKVLAEDVDDEVRARFESDCRRLSGLLHPNLVSGLSSGEVDGRPYLILEHVEGRSLQALIRAERQLAETRALRLGIQIGGALAYLHAEGLVHGDPSPRSILVTSDEVAKLGRMNLTRPVGWDGLDRHGRPAGVAGFMSPEQATSSGAMTDRSNVYTLGAVLYDLLTGRSPAEDATAEIVDGRVLERPPPLRIRRPDLSQAAVLAVESFLEPLPEERPTGAMEVVETLERALSESSQKRIIRPQRGAARRARVRRMRKSRAATRDASEGARRKRRR